MPARILGFDSYGIRKRIVSMLFVVAVVNIVVGCLFTRTHSASFSPNAVSVLTVHILGFPIIAIIVGALLALIPSKAKSYQIRFVRSSFFILLGFELFILFGLLVNVWFYIMHWQNVFQMRPVS